MMLDSPALQQTNIDQAAFGWICSLPWTHALTLTYPVVKSAAGQGTRIDGTTGKVQVIPGVKSFSNRPAPRWASSTDSALRSDLYELSARVDGKLFGKRFNEKPLSSRSNFFAFPAGTQPGCMLHVHMIWAVPEDRWIAFENLFADGAQKTPWTKLVVAGTHKLERIYDIDGWVKYCVRQSSLQEMIMSQELVFV